MMDLYLIFQFVKGRFHGNHIILPLWRQTDTTCILCTFARWQHGFGSLLLARGRHCGTSALYARLCHAFLVIVLPIFELNTWPEITNKECLSYDTVLSITTSSKQLYSKNKPWRIQELPWEVHTGWGSEGWAPMQQRCRGEPPLGGLGPKKLKPKNALRCLSESD